MQIFMTANERTLIVTCTGELDHHHAERVRNMIDMAIETRNIKDLVFDFSTLSFMDSSGIGMIIGRYKKIRSLGGKVKLVCRETRMKQLIQMSGLTKLIEVCPDLAQAIKEVQGA